MRYIKIYKSRGKLEDTVTDAQTLEMMTLGNSDTLKLTP